MCSGQRALVKGAIMTRCFKVMLPILNGVNNLEYLFSITVILLKFERPWVGGYCRVEYLLGSQIMLTETGPVIYGVGDISRTAGLDEFISTIFSPLPASGGDQPETESGRFGLVPRQKSNPCFRTGDVSYGFLIY